MIWESFDFQKFLKSWSCTFPFEFWHVRVRMDTIWIFMACPQPNLSCAVSCKLLLKFYLGLVTDALGQRIFYFLFFFSKCIHEIFIEKSLGIFLTGHTFNSITPIRWWLDMTERQLAFSFLWNQFATWWLKVFPPAIVLFSRHRSHWTFPPRQPVAEDLHRAGGPLPLPGPRGWSSDHTALLPAGGTGTSERSLLLLLWRAEGVRSRPWRGRCSQAVGGQWEALWTEQLLWRLSSLAQCHWSGSQKPSPLLEVGRRSPRTLIVFYYLGHKQVLLISCNKIGGVLSPVWDIQVF